MDDLFKSSTIVNGDIAGLNFETIIVANKAYTIEPPTIAKLSRAAYHLPKVGDCDSISELIQQMQNIEDAAKALSCFICGTEKKAEELKNGTLDEIVSGLETAYNMLSLVPFKKLSVLAKNVIRLTVNPKS